MELNEAPVKEEVKRGFKKTEVGLIPEDWEVKPLSEVFYFTGGKAHEQFIVPFGKFTVINSKFIASEGTVRKYADTSVCSPKKGSIALVMSDLPNGKALGKCFLVDEDDRYVLNQRVCALTARRDFPPYLFHALNRNKYFLSFNDGVSQTHLLNPIVLKCPVVIPSTQEEQRAIATALSDVDALLCSLDTLIAKKKAIKQGAMQQLLTGQQRLPGFKGEWGVKKLGEVAEVVSGATPRTSNPSNWNGDILWCTPTDITGTIGKYISTTERQITKQGLEGCNTRLLPIGALLLCTRATIGEVKIAAAPICTNQGFKSLICNAGTNNEFLYYKLLTMKAQMVEQAIGSTFLELSRKDTVALEIKLPTHEEQTAIATVLCAMDAEIGALAARRAKTALLKQGMMQELLTGRVRLA